MSTKPTLELSRWATGGVNITVPNSGERDTGFVPGTPASSKRVNSLINQLYLWAQYLSDGALSGDHTIGGTLEVGGTLTCDEVAVMEGDITIGGLCTVGGTTTLTGAVTTGSDVTTAGKVTVGGQLLAFTDFTFTADNTTDQLTKTAHGLETGDGPVRTSNSGGALPGGLTAGTDYWVIKIDANNFKLAISSDANAFAGIAIDITSNGTGTQTLNHQPTTKRSSDATVTRNLTVGGLVNSLTFANNASITLQGTGSYKHGLKTLPIHAALAVAVVGTVTFTNNVANFSGSGSQLLLPVLLPSGKSISAVRVYVIDNTGPTKVTATLHSMNITTGGDATLNTSAQSAGGGATQTIQFTGLADAISGGLAYSIIVTITTGSGLCQLLGCDVDYSE